VYKNQNPCILLCLKGVTVYTTCEDTGGSEEAWCTKLSIEPHNHIAVIRFSGIRESIFSYTKSTAEIRIHLPIQMYTAYTEIP
jgi:hypothetical protein